MLQQHDFIRHRVHHHHSYYSNSSICPLGGEKGDFGWFALQGFITFINVSAICANIFFIVICVRAGVMHRNMRLMLSTISICFAINALAGLLYNLYFFYLGIYGFPYKATKSVWCSTINVAMVPWDAATCLLMVGVGAERLIATKRHITSGVISLYVKGMFLFAWSAAIYVTINYVANLTDEGVCVCDGASLTERYAMLLRISICAVVEAGTISLFGYVLILSRSEADGLGINTAKYSLSKRFQIYETYRTTQMLLPSAVLHAVLYLSYLCLLIPIRDLRAEPNLTVYQYNLSTIIFAFPSLHALAHPIICLRRHYYLRQRVDDIFKKFFPKHHQPVSIQQNLSVEESVKLNDTPELHSSPSFRSETGRIEYRIAPERHAEILEAFWEKK